jgi:hypothetical protein
MVAAWQIKVLVGYIATQSDRSPQKATRKLAGARSNADGHSANYRQEALWRKKLEILLVGSLISC